MKYPRGQGSLLGPQIALIPVPERGRALVPKDQDQPSATPVDLCKIPVSKTVQTSKLKSSWPCSPTAFHEPLLGFMFASSFQLWVGCLLA